MHSDKVKQHFNAAAQAEWERLDVNEYFRLIFRLHLAFIEKELAEKPRILDAGSGPGRYALEFAKRGCAVTLCDISDGELALAEEKFGENDIAAERFVQADLRDLSAFPDGAFDLTVCYGAPLSYITENREKAVSELVRVTRRGGTVAVSVNNTWGILRNMLGKTDEDFFANGDYWRINEVIETGDCPSFESVKFGGKTAPEKHFFQPDELADVLKNAGLANIELGAAPCLCSGNREQYNKLAENPAAKAQLEALELKCYRDKNMVGFGDFLLAKGIKI
ncbi:MAG: class I SAM-dependent methyltransferase [Ruminococcaceae bacterium]|nr:class I SAM-dependent methyltransferase [Oscillospiraceae bacterium]